MYNLDVNSSLQIFRGQNVVTREMVISSTYGDINADGTLTLNTDFDTNTSGTVAKTFVSAPTGIGITRQVKRIEINNQDVISDNVSIQHVLTSGTWVVKRQVNLQIGSSLNYEDALGWYVTDTNGQKAIGGN